MGLVDHEAGGAGHALQPRLETAPPTRDIGHFMLFHAILGFVSRDFRLFSSDFMQCSSYFMLFSSDFEVFMRSHRSPTLNSMLFHIGFSAEAQHVAVGRQALGRHVEQVNAAAGQVVPHLASHAYQIALWQG